MKSLFTSIVLLLGLSCQMISAQQPPTVLWQKCIGGSAFDAGFGLVETGNHQFFVTSNCYSSDGDLSTNFGSGDAALFSLDGNGNFLPSNNIWGGLANDAITSIANTNDGGFILSGSTMSNDRDILGNHGGGDILVIKTDGQTNLEWQRCLGGPGIDEVRSIIQTPDGGFFLTGGSQSVLGDIRENKGDWDLWVVKLNSCGQIEWQKSLGGPGIDYAFGGILDNNGDYVVTGLTTSNTIDVSGNHGSWDYWVLKLDPIGNLIWQKCFGGSSQDESRSISLSSDGAYLINGWTTSSDGDVTQNKGGRDIWVIKIGSDGNLIWEYSFGGSGDEIAYNVFETEDGNIVALGQTESSDGDVSNYHGGRDSWLVQFDASGNINWDLSLGGSDEDNLRFVAKADDGDYILSGNTGSNDGDVSGNHGDRDIWVVKLTGVTGLMSDHTSKTDLVFYPNPTKDYLYLPGYSGNLFIYSSDGKVVSQIKNIENSKRVDFSKLPAGMYTLRLLSKDKEYWGKVTKQ